MTPKNIQMFMEVIAKALHGTAGTIDWNQQTSFLRSPDGQNYLAKLTNTFKNMPRGQPGRRGHLAPGPET
jgi:hypothetical protein